MKWLAALAAIFALTACGENVSEPVDSGTEVDRGDDDGNQFINTHTVTLNDGTTVECVTYTYGQGAIWCTQ